MEPNLEGWVGKTGLLTYKYSIDQYIFYQSNRRNIRELIQVQSQNAIERIKRGIERILYKVIEDGREYDFHNGGLRSWTDINPPFEHFIEGRMSVGLNNANDCAAGEYWLARINSHPGDYWAEWRGPTFRYEGDYLWRRIA